jgi:hypothetical protein
LGAGWPVATEARVGETAVAKAKVEKTRATAGNFMGGKRVTINLAKSSAFASPVPGATVPFLLPAACRPASLPG